MADTSKLRCETCTFSVTVEEGTSWVDALAAAKVHIEENKTHEICGVRMVWTDNPYVAPLEE